MKNKKLFHFCIVALLAAVCCVWVGSFVRFSSTLNNPTSILAVSRDGLDFYLDEHGNYRDARDQASVPPLMTIERSYSLAKGRGCFISQMTDFPEISLLDMRPAYPFGFGPKKVYYIGNTKSGFLAGSSGDNNYLVTNIAGIRWKISNRRLTTYLDRREFAKGGAGSCDYIWPGSPII